MARTKQTARKSTSGAAPRKLLAPKRDFKREERDLKDVTPVYVEVTTREMARRSNGGLSPREPLRRIDEDEAEERSLKEIIPVNVKNTTTKAPREKPEKKVLEKSDRVTRSSVKKAGSDKEDE